MSIELAQKEQLADTMVKDNSWVNEGVNQSDGEVLIVDDEPEILDLMENLLEMEGFGVLRAESGEEALKISKGKSLSVVISDYRMPGMNGIELITELKKTHIGVPMIIATGYADVNIAIEAINNGGAYKLFKKPWDPFDLLQEIKLAIEHSYSEKIRRELEAELQKQNDILEVKVLQRTSELDAVIKELQEANDTITQTYQHLLQSDKLATMGLMAGTVAHDIANPLTVVISRARMILMKEDIEESLANNLNIIVRNSLKIDRLITSITRFAKKSSTEFKHFNVEEVIQEVLLMFSKSIKMKTVVVEENYEEKSVNVWGEPNQMEQVFTNLIQNAVQAMDLNGKLFINTKSIDGYLRVTLEDTGPGIPEDKLEDIFEAFYTTKDDGTGLGLNICKRIIHEHSGEIRVVSELGKGTKFTIDLPVNPNDRKD